MNKANSYKGLYIVTGAGGVLGKEFVERYSQDSAACVVACSRMPLATAKPNVYWLRSQDSHFQRRADRANREEIYGSDDFPVSADQFCSDRAISITLVYPIGPFEFDAQTARPARLMLSDVNPRIYDLNVSGVHNYVKATSNLFRKWERNVCMRVVCFGSISNRFKPLFWQGYSLSKQALRRYLQRIARARSTDDCLLSTLMVNTSTIDTGSERNIRPGATHAERAGWLQCSAVVDRVVEELSDLPIQGCKEIELYAPTEQRPDYNSIECFERWQRQMKLHPRERPIF